MREAGGQAVHFDQERYAPILASTGRISNLVSEFKRNLYAGYESEQKIPSKAFVPNLLKAGTQMHAALTANQDELRHKFRSEVRALNSSLTDDLIAAKAAE
jgi:hypothetical protein